MRYSSLCAANNYKNVIIYRSRYKTTNSIEKFFRFWVHIIDIIIYRGILRDKLQQMTLNQYLAPIISLCTTLSIACLIIGSHSMDIVKILH